LEVGVWRGIDTILNYCTEVSGHKFSQRLPKSAHCGRGCRWVRPLGFGMARRGEAASRRLDGRRLVTGGGRLRGLGLRGHPGGSQEIDAQGAAHVVTIRQLPIHPAAHDHGVGRTVLLQLMKQPVGLLQLEVRGGGSGLDRRGGKDGAWGRGNTAGCDRASESRIKVRLRDATPMRSWI
jgi:hypothetical protein